MEQQLSLKLVLLLIFCIIIPVCSFANFNSAALYYGDHIPVNELKAFDVVVVQPQAGFNPNTLASANTKVFAYVNVGEVDANNQRLKAMDPHWFIGKNNTWQSKVVDLSNPQYRQFVLQKIITPLWQQGYRGFFLDTLDSYYLVSDKQPFVSQQQQGLIEIITAIKQQYPQAALIFNRGFEILPKIHQDIFAVAAESLYSG